MAAAEGAAGVPLIGAMKSAVPVCARAGAADAASRASTPAATNRMFILMFTLFPVVLAVLLLSGCHEFSLASMPRTDNIFR